MTDLTDRRPALPPAAPSPTCGPAPPDAGRRRCWWPTDAPLARLDPAMVAYHDAEWGVPVTDDRELFERLALESFQAGLAWATILHKRAAFRRAFAGFEPAAVAAFDAVDRARLLADAAIVRNQAKIEATIGNAGRFLEVVQDEGSFATFLAARLPGPRRPLPPAATAADLPTTTAASDALSAELRRRGFRFVGPTITYAFMQSVGLVDDHLPGCHRYRGG